MGTWEAGGGAGGGDCECDEGGGEGGVSAGRDIDGGKADEGTAVMYLVDDPTVKTFESSP